MIGGIISQIFILGRKRNIITKNRCKFIKYKKELISLKEAKKKDKSIYLKQSIRKV